MKFFDIRNEVINIIKSDKTCQQKIDAIEDFLCEHNNEWSFGDGGHAKRIREAGIFDGNELVEQYANAALSDYILSTSVGKSVIVSGMVEARKNYGDCVDAVFHLISNPFYKSDLDIKTHVLV